MRRIRATLKGIANIIHEIIHKTISWFGNVTLEYPINDGLEAVTLYGWTEKKWLLPDWYTQLDYVSFTWEQYINTWILTSNTIWYDIVFKWTTSSKCLLWGRTTYDTNGFCLWHTTMNTCFFSYWWATTSYSITTRPINWDWHRIILDSSTARIDDEDVVITRATATSFTPIALWTWLTGSVYDARRYVWDVKYLRIYDDTWNLWYFIPAKRDSDWAVWFYDIVRKSFYVSNSSTAFSWGVEVDIPEWYSRLEYVENTDRARIDTWISWNTDFIIEAQQNSTLTRNSVLIWSSLSWWYYYWVISSTNKWWAWANEWQYSDIDWTYRATSRLSFTANWVSWSVSLYSSDSSSSFSRETTVSHWNFSLFSWPSSWYEFTWKVYYLQAYKDWVLISNMIPVCRLSDWEVWMYDTVRERFYWNATSWQEFVWWPTVLTYKNIVCNNWILTSNGCDWTIETIKIIGKNLFNKDDEWIEWWYNIWGDWTVSASTYNSSSWYIPCKPNTAYTVSFISSAASSITRYHLYNSDKERISQATQYSSSWEWTQTVTFTTSSDTRYIRFTFRWLTADAPDLSTNIQVEEWNTATDYEAYTVLWTATAEMLLKLWDYVDEQEILNWNITRKIWIKVLDGTENWTKGTYAVANYSFWTDDTSLAILTDRTILCTHFQSSQTLPPATQAGRDNKIWRGTSDIAGTQASICIGYNFDGTVAQFKQWLAEQYSSWTPVILVYPLATPTTETVAWQTLTSVRSNTNTIEITQAWMNPTDLQLEVDYLWYDM